MWHSLSIFLSSTFSDMHAERDYFKHIILPKIEEHLQANKVKIEIIDLRWGIDTTHTNNELEKETQVLKVCLDEVKRSKPFFIGLLGDRYGWIPDKNRIEEAIKNADYSFDLETQSVTSLEIELGVLQDPEQCKRSLFYFRQLDYSNMDKTWIHHFRDSNTFDSSTKNKNLTKLKELKTKIERVFNSTGHSGNVKEYKAKWDSVKSTVIGLEEWGELIFDDLIKQIKEHIDENSENLPQTQDQLELQLQNKLIEEHCNSFIGKTNFISQLLNNIQDTMYGVLLEGGPGSGKTAILSQLYNSLNKPENIILYHNTRLSSSSMELTQMLKNWIIELSKYNDDSENIGELPEQANDLLNIWNLSLYKACETKPVYLIIDGAENFENTLLAKSLSWLSTPLPDNVHFIASVTKGEEHQILDIHQEILISKVEPLNIDEAKTIVRNRLNQTRKDLPEEAFKEILNKKQNDGLPAISNPLWLSMCIDLLINLDLDDYRAIMQSDKEADYAIKDYLINQIQEFAPSYDELFLQVIQKSGRVFGNSFVNRVFKYLSASRNGLRESDLNTLFERANCQWEPIKFANLRRWLKKHIQQHGEDGKWYLTNNFLKQSELTIYKNKEELKQIHGEIASYLLELKNDSVKNSELLYHLSKANNFTQLGHYIYSELTSEENEGAIKFFAKTIGYEALLDPIFQKIETEPDFTSILKRLITLFCQIDDYAANYGAMLRRENFLYKLYEKVMHLIEKKGDNYSDLKKHFIMSGLLGKLGNIWHGAGKTQFAQKICEYEYKHLKKYYSKDKQNEELVRKYIFSLGTLYEIYNQIGKSKKAFKLMLLEDNLGSEMMNMNTKNQDEFKNFVCIANLNLGQYFLIKKDLTKAENHLRKSFDLALNVKFKRHTTLIDSSMKLGTVFINKGDGNLATKHLDEALSWAKEYCKIQPSSESNYWLSTVYMALGQFNFANQQPDLAIKKLKKGVKSALKAFNSDTQNTIKLNNLLNYYFLLGSLYEIIDNYDDAVNYFHKFIALFNANETSTNKEQQKQYQFIQTKLE